MVDMIRATSQKHETSTNVICSRWKEKHEKVEFGCWATILKMEIPKEEVTLGQCEPVLNVSSSFQ
jgi:hypothetical protein